MSHILVIQPPDSEYEHPFRAYSNYLIDLESEIRGNYGSAGAVVPGVINGVYSHASKLGIQRRALSVQNHTHLSTALQRAWGDLRRLRRDIDDFETFDEDSNAWLPVQAYYAAVKAILAFAVASGQAVPGDHRKILNLIAKEVVRGLLPYPWSAYCCGGFPEGTRIFGSRSEVMPVHVLSSPDPDLTADRLAMFLRTTRDKELNRRFATARRRGVAPGRKRRNLSRHDKANISDHLPATTIFDLLWRLRIKANYGDADTFVLGAAGRADAYVFATALVTLADATVAALEALIILYVGQDAYAAIVASYCDRIKGELGPVLAIRSELVLMP